MGRPTRRSSRGIGPRRTSRGRAPARTTSRGVIPCPIVTTQEGRRAVLAEERESRMLKVKEEINEMSEERAKKLLLLLTDKMPGLVLDIINWKEPPSIPSDGYADEPPPSPSLPEPSPSTPTPESPSATPGPSTHGAASSPPGPSPPGSPSPPGPAAAVNPWCVCRHCTAMQQRIEDICCGMEPDRCLCNIADMDRILDEFQLQLNIRYRNDWYPAPAGDDDPIANHRRALRHAAYRKFTLYMYGRLTVGDRRVIPSCVVTKIRERFPDPTAHYKGFQPANYV